MKTVQRKSIKTIFNWQSRDGHSIHCLLRLYINDNKKNVVVIASELETNQDNTPITHDIQGLKEAVIQAFGESLGRSEESLNLIVHYGDFSLPHSYSNNGYNDEFALVELSRNETSDSTNGEQWRVLTSTEVSEILDGVILEPVEQVVSELSHH